MEKVIGKGTYGCVIKPMPQPYYYTNYISYDENDVVKIFKQKTEMYKEWDNSKEIEKIDPEHKVTVNMKEIQILNNNIHNKNYINPVYRERICKMCELIDYYDNNDESCSYPKYNVYQIVMKNGGTDVTNFKEKMHYFNFKTCFSDVCDFFIQYHNKALIHRDIKPDNILIGKTENNKQYPYKLNIIDFGIQVSIADTFDVSNLLYLNHNYVFYPPEFVLVASIYNVIQGYSYRMVSDYIFLLNLLQDPNEINFIRNKMLERFQEIKFSNIFQKHYNKDASYKNIDNFINKYIEYLINNKQDLQYMSISNIIVTSFAQLSAGCDVYGMGIVFCKLYDNIIFDNNAQRTEYLNIINDMINPNVIDRKTFTSLKEIYCNFNNTIQKGGIIPRGIKNNSLSSYKSRKSIIKKLPKYMNLNLKDKYKLDLSKYFKKIKSKDTERINEIINKNSFGTLKEFKFLKKFSSITSSQSSISSINLALIPKRTSSRLNLSPIKEESSSSNSMKTYGGDKKKKNNYLRKE